MRTLSVGSIKLELKTKYHIIKRVVFFSIKHSSIHHNLLYGRTCSKDFLKIERQNF